MIISHKKRFVKQIRRFKGEIRVVCGKIHFSLIICVGIYGGKGRKWVNLILGWKEFINWEEGA